MLAYEDKAPAGKTARLPTRDDTVYVFYSPANPCRKHNVLSQTCFDVVVTIRRFSNNLDFQPFDAVENIRAKSSVFYPGIDDMINLDKRESGPMRILWAARWEHDKNPEDFFDALEILKQRNIDFKISVIGQSFRDVPEIFEKSKIKFGKYIENWGYQNSREEYERIGDVPNLVFSCGATIEPDGQVRIYYGAANSCICVGTCKLSNIIHACVEGTKEF